MSAPDDFASTEDGIYRGRTDRPFRVLVNSLVEEIQRLVRLELELFKREMGTAAQRLMVGLVAVAIGAIFALTGWFALFAAAVIAVAIVWPAWAAALVLGVVILLVAGGLLYFGVRRMQAQRLAPTHTLNTLREDGAWIRERIL